MLASKGSTGTGGARRKQERRTEEDKRKIFAIVP
jgi:hypothetical protein